MGAGARALISMMPTTTLPRPATSARLWMPKHVLVTRSAAELPHGAEIIARCEPPASTTSGCSGDRLTGLTRRDRARGLRPGEAHPRRGRRAAQARKLQPIPPSADWRVDLAEGCPAHCQYCYLAGSLTGPPITRVYANLEEILRHRRPRGPRRRDQRHRRARRTRAPLRGVLLHRSAGPRAPHRVAGRRHRPRRHRRLCGPAWRCASPPSSPTSARCSTSPHAGRTRVRFSVNAAAVAQRFEGGTARMPDRLAALRALALAGYPVGLTIAPIMPVPGWREEYGRPARRRRRGARRRAGPRPHRRAHHPPLHPERARRCCWAGTRRPSSRWTRSCAARSGQVRRRQVRLSASRSWHELRRVVRDRAGRAAARGPLPLLDLSPTMAAGRPPGESGWRDWRGAGHLAGEGPPQHASRDAPGWTQTERVTGGPTAPALVARSNRARPLRVATTAIRSPEATRWGPRSQVQPPPAGAHASTRLVPASASS